MRLGFAVFLQAVSLFTGWLIKSAADGKIDGQEWAELGLLTANTLGIPTTVTLPQLTDTELETPTMADVKDASATEETLTPKEQLLKPQSTAEGGDSE